MITLVGGVSELYQGDLDVGRRVVERLESEALGQGVVVEDLHYGAVAVAQRLEELDPDALVLVGAVARDREPGAVHRTVADPPAPPTTDEVQGMIGDAVTGYVGIDLVIEIASAFGALPPRVVTIEVEPVETGPSDQLSAAVANTLPALLDAVKAEVQRTPVHVAARELRERLEDGHLEDAPATELLVALLEELRRSDHDGRWGATFRLRDDLVAALGAGETSERMDHADWGLVWGLVEELGRLEKIDAAGVDQPSIGSS